MQEKSLRIPKKDWIEGRRRLLEWFDVHQRPLPWRENPTPYATWLCEIIMQQTRIEQGLRYWYDFLTLWPDVDALAASSLDDVLKAWQGLGYYSRARNLHRAAQLIAHERDGQFPTSAKEWKNIPGVGPYTAAAIASICQGECVAAIDGNVLRVISRLLGVQEPIDRPAGRNQIETFSEEWLSEIKPGTHNEAVMELGATVCTPRAPQCPACPLSDICRSDQANTGLTPLIPTKEGKVKVQDVHLTFHVVTSGQNVWMRQRPENGVWGGLWEFPSHVEQDGKKHTTAPLPPKGMEEGNVSSHGAWGHSFEHILSHRRLTCRFWIWKTDMNFKPFEGRWLSWKDAKKLAIPRALDRFWLDLEKSQSTNMSS